MKLLKTQVDEIEYMDFCEDCDSLLTPKKKDGKVLSFCPDCDEFKDGDVTTGGSFAIPNEAREDIEKDPEGGKMLILEESDNRTVGRPSKEMFCGNCEEIQEIEYWEIQTRSADESPTRFFKCLTCEKQWREYD